MIILGTGLGMLFIALINFFISDLATPSGKKYIKDLQPMIQNWYGDIK